jgi:hypothetical protein
VTHTTTGREMDGHRPGPTPYRRCAVSARGVRRDATGRTAVAEGLGRTDATIVRALLVPALVSRFGRWNWWLPAWLARPLRVEPSPAASEPRPTPIPAQRAEPEGQSIEELLRP